MPRVPIHNLGSLGVICDTPPEELPPEAWSNVKNMRFQDNKAVKFTGHGAVFDPPTVPPYWALGVPTNTTFFWLYMGQDKAYAFNAAVHSNITRAGGDYTGNVDNLWDGGILGGIPVVNNGVDDPQSWSPVDAGQLLVDLPNWPANTQCKAIKPFKNFLIAMNITLNSVNSPHKVKWSHPADPGSVPITWDETDPTKDAGENELSDVQSGIIQDGVQLRDMFLVYKDNSVTGMQFQGGQFIFRFFTIFSQLGILTQRCAVLTPDGARHFVATGDDIVVHDGQTAVSIIDKKLRRSLSNMISTDDFQNSFCVTHTKEDECWFCFPESGSTLPTIAFVWNSLDNTFGFRDLSEAAFITPGAIEETVTGNTWNSDGATWDSDMSVWGQRDFDPRLNDLLQCDPTNTKFYQLDNGDQFNGVNINAFLERTGLAIVGRDRQGEPKVDIGSRKLVTRIWPKGAGSPFNVRVGAQEIVGGPITWQVAKTFTPGVDQFLDFTVNGRLLAVSFESNTQVNWKLHSYDLEVEVLGTF